MRKSRLFLPGDYQANQTLELSKEQAHYVLTVLRLKAGTQIEAFNGKGMVAQGKLDVTGRRSANLIIEACLDAEASLSSESPLNTVLVQGISRGDRMDHSIQKSVELGVTAIQPVFTERCEVKLQGEKLEKRRQQWQTIAINACEQSGRNVLPDILAIKTLKDWIADRPEQHLSLVLDPLANQSLSQIKKPETNTPIYCLIGPEGGLSDDEIVWAKQHNFTPLQLGPRVLRTETAGPATIAILQAFWGDLS